MAVSGLIGSWSLDDYRAVSEHDDHPLLFPLGPNAQGIITYTSCGIMAANIMRPGAKPHENSGAPHGGTAEERANSMLHTLAYSGPYTVRTNKEDINQLTVRHQVVVSSFPNWIGTTQCRLATVKANQLVLETDQPIEVEVRLHLYIVCLSFKKLTY
jgi:hypothetical protein